MLQKAIEKHEVLKLLLTAMAVDCAELHGCFVRGLLYSEVLFGTAKTGCCTCYRGDCLMKTFYIYKLAGNRLGPSSHVMLR